MKIMGMTKEGVLGKRGIMPLWGANAYGDRVSADESLSGYLSYYKTFVTCAATKFHKSACLYIPDVSIQKEQ